MVVTVAAVRMMEVAVHQVVHVVAVRNLRMAAFRAVNMRVRVRAAVVLRRAGSGVARRDTQDVLIDVIAMNVVQVAIVEIIRVAVVSDGDMAAPRLVLMPVSFMRHAVALCHLRHPSFQKHCSSGPVPTINFTPKKFIDQPLDSARAPAYTAYDLVIPIHVTIVR